MGAQSSGSFLFSEWETQSQPTGQSAVSFIFKNMSLLVFGTLDCTLILIVLTKLIFFAKVSKHA